MHVELHCFDFMDRVPVAQLPLEVALLVTPMYFHPADEPGEPGDPGDPPPLHPHATIDPEFDLAEVFTAALVTDADGRAAVDFHAATAWQRVAQIRLGNALPRTVIGYLNAGGTPPWIELYTHGREVKVMHPDDEPKVGMQVRTGGPGHGEVLTIVAVEGDVVTLDGNHQLAGVPLTFDVKVVSVRAATKQELAHGHPHGSGGHDH